MKSHVPCASTSSRSSTAGACRGKLGPDRIRTPPPAEELEMSATLTVCTRLRWTVEVDRGEDEYGQPTLLVNLLRAWQFINGAWAEIGCDDPYFWSIQDSVREYYDENSAAL